jgi:hypothetical protein
MKSKTSIGPLDWQRLPFSLYPCLRLLGNETSYSQAQRMWSTGLITDRQWRWYVLFWTWSVPRFSNIEQASNKQAKCREAHGFKGLERRFGRIQQLREKLIHHWLGPFLSIQPTS